MYGNMLTFSLLLMTQAAFVDIVDQDQAAQNVVWSLIHTVHIFVLEYNWAVSLSCNESVFFANEKLQLIGSQRVHSSPHIPDI